jgi:hypothetical protein
MIMETVPRNVVLDLLPAYLAGEASEESRALVEAYAQHDPEIARLIRVGKLEPATPSVAPPVDLEVKALRRIRRSVRRQMVYAALGTAALLMIPLLARFPWSLGDFIVMGALLFGTGLTYVLISRLSDSLAYRAAVGLAVAAGFLLIWVNLAVGIIGSEDNPANQLYAGVLLIGFVGAVIARFRPRAMSYVLYAAAIAQMLVPVAALIIWRSTLDEPPGIAGVLILNAFFAGLFTLSGALFRRASETTQAANM